MGGRRCFKEGSSRGECSALRAHGSEGRVHSTADHVFKLVDGLLGCGRNRGRWMRFWQVVHFRKPKFAPMTSPKFWFTTFFCWMWACSIFFIFWHCMGVFDCTSTISRASLSVWRCLLNQLVPLQSFDLSHTSAHRLP